MNHGGHYNSGCRVHLEEEGKRVVLRAQQAHPKGEQVFINYGGVNNGLLLLNYGFVVPENLTDTYEVTPPSCFQTQSPN